MPHFIRFHVYLVLPPFMYSQVERRGKLGVGRLPLNKEASTTKVYAISLSPASDHSGSTKGECNLMLESRSFNSSFIYDPHSHIASNSKTTCFSFRKCAKPFLIHWHQAPGSHYNSALRCELCKPRTGRTMMMMVKAISASQNIFGALKRC